MSKHSDYIEGLNKALLGPGDEQLKPVRERVARLYLERTEVSRAASLHTEAGVLVAIGAFEDRLSKCELSISKSRGDGPDALTGFPVLREFGRG